MHNLDDMIEKYRHELMEFSKQNPIHNETEECREAVSVMAQPIEREDAEFDTDVRDVVVPKPYADNADFEARNSSAGMLRVQVFAADRSFPISGAEVTVTVPFLAGSRDIFTGATDADGILDNISLPAPDKSLSLNEDNTIEPFALYNIKVSHPDFADGEYFNVPVFDSVKSIQPVELVPLTQTGNEPDDIEFGGESYGS